MGVELMIAISALVASLTYVSFLVYWLDGKNMSKMIEKDREDPHLSLLNSRINVPATAMPFYMDE